MSRSAKAQRRPAPETTSAIPYSAFSVKNACGTTVPRRTACEQLLIDQKERRMATAAASATVAQGPMGPCMAAEAPEFRVARKGIMVVLGQLEVEVDLQKKVYGMLVSPNQRQQAAIVGLWQTMRTSIAEGDLEHVDQLLHGMADSP